MANENQQVFDLLRALQKTGTPPAPHEQELVPTPEIANAVLGAMAYVPAKVLTDSTALAAKNLPSSQGGSSRYEDYKKLEEQNPDTGLTNVAGATLGMKADNPVASKLRGVERADNYLPEKLGEVTGVPLL